MFAVGSQCGLLPDQVLDLNLPQMRAVIQGYQDHLFDLKCLTVYAGYWAGYYSSAKRPKPVGTILQELLNSHKRAEGHSLQKPEVDVEEFLRREEEFNRRLQGR